MRIALLFAGQGAQYTGMGLSLFEASPAARAVFFMADKLRKGTSAQCFYAPKEELFQTVNTQPCVFTVGLAAARALEEHGIMPYAVAGFSLGEIAALTFAGAFTEEEGFDLVMKRAALMQTEAERTPSSMAAVLKLDAAEVEALCGSMQGVYPVNYNCPGQTVVAGEKEALKAFCTKVAEQNGRTIGLNVSGGFHSPFMEHAAHTLLTELSFYPFRAPQIPVFANATALPYAEPFKETLAMQVKSPVLFQKTVEALLKQGVDTFIEAGPGKTLCGLVEKIAPELEKVYSVQDGQSLFGTLAALKAGEGHA
ncbi:MAG TPA: ACP S-malonyltransferase [Clostridia bacterium]|nr:ACP S-malonyltransferase [Clostridia bacterium]